ncbi:MAG: hypothetical protein B7Z74_05805, partial [Deltaproteobacteria bacterium 21-66-5]
MKDNVICRLLKIRYPILVGGMTWVSEAVLAAAVSEAGGLGTIATGNMPGELLRDEVRKLRTLTDKPFAVTLDVGSSLANRTGSWRVERPVYVDRMPPCNDACPAGENVQSWLYHAEEGAYEAAWRALVAENPLPAVCGRICYHPCETACNRAHVDEAVGIHGVE